MPLFRKKAGPAIPYDPATRTPVVRRSICTGEMTVGFIDRESGKFQEYQLARDQKELADFCRAVGIDPDDLKTIY